MLRAKSKKQQHLFDPWQFMSPKRRKMLGQDWPGFFRDHILDLMPVEKMALLFPSKYGRPTKEMHTVLGALTLQQYHDLTDKETSDQLSYNSQWHYALDVVEESDEAKYICPKTLWTMRTLATELGLDQELFDTTTQKLAEMFQVDTGHQRIDSVHIRSNMARLGRVGIFVKAIARFLLNLRRQYRPMWDKVDAELIERYCGKKSKECFAGIKPSQSKKVLADVASDLYRLVTQFEHCQRIADMNSYKLLCRIVKEQCEVGSDGTVEVKAPEKIRSDSLQNPSDPDATYSGHKGQGYQVQIMETYSEHDDDKKKADDLNLITYVAVEKACQSDAQALLPAIEETLEKGLAPEQLQADSLYGSDDNVQQAEQLGVELISPAMGTEKSKTIKLSDFSFTAEGHVDQCPAGHSPILCKKNKKSFRQSFAIELCRQCPLASDCPVKQGSEFFELTYSHSAMRLAKRRQYEQSEEFRQKYRWRAGVEATMSQYDRMTGAKHLRVRGFKAVRYAAVMKAIAVNLARAVAARQAQLRSDGGDLGPNDAGGGLFSIFKELFGGFFQSFPDFIRANRMLSAYAYNVA